LPKGDATRWLAAAEVDQARGEWLDPNLGTAPFDDMVDSWWPTATGTSPASFRW